MLSCAAESRLTGLLDAGIKSLNDAIDHGKQKHADVAKKSAEEAVTHLKAAH